jgi:DNA polymerase-3 subunit alpha
MASVLTHNLSNIEKITFFMEECRRMGLTVLGPDINESIVRFSVNTKGQIRFGLGAIKGVGEGAVESILEERKNGWFNSIFNLTSRINLRSANRKTLEALAVSGAFDCFTQHHRAQYVMPGQDGTNGIEKAIRYGNNLQQQKHAAQVSLFGSSENSTHFDEPELPKADPWPNSIRLTRERDVVGFYLSGHPLDEYKADLRTFCTATLSDYQRQPGRELRMACIVNEVSRNKNKQGKPIMIAVVQDYLESTELFLSDEPYFKFNELFQPDNLLFIRGIFRPRNPDAPSKFDLKITDVCLLDNVRERRSEGIHLNLPIQQITDELVNRIKANCQKHQGEKKMKVTFLYPEEKLVVDCNALAYKVNLSNEFLQELDAMNIDYKLLA